jgi:hypothetical protein
MSKKKKKLNKRERRARDHAAAVNSKHTDAKDKVTKKKKDMDSLPSRTSHYDKKAGVYKTAGEKIRETKDQVTYRWVEDGGGENVQVKNKTVFKDHAKARFEGERQYSRDGKSVEMGSWAEDCGNHCKINKEKFDEGYKSIFGTKKRGAAAGKYKKFKKSY